MLLKRNGLYGSRVMKSPSRIDDWFLPIKPSLPTTIDHFPDHLYAFLSLSSNISVGEVVSVQLLINLTIMTVCSGDDWIPWQGMDWIRGNLMVIIRRKFAPSLFRHSIRLFYFFGLENGASGRMDHNKTGHQKMLQIDKSAKKFGQTGRLKNAFFR